MRRKVDLVRRGDLELCTSKRRKSRIEVTMGEGLRRGPEELDK